MLACFTGVLAFVSCLQIWLLIQGGRAAREQAVEMKKASDLAETQNTIIAAQTDIQAKQHELDRLQFFATHRPRFVARQFQVVDFQPTQTPIIRFAVFNIGATSGYIREYNTAVILLDEFGKIFGLPRFETNPTLVKDAEVTGGGAYYIMATENTPLDPADFIAVGDKRKIMHVFGYIRYADDTGTVRRIGFLRGFDVTLRRFRPVDDPEYEYAD